MPMLRVPRRMLRAFAIGLCLTAQPLLVLTASAQQPKPNILFILADNIGYGDMGLMAAASCAARRRRASIGLAAESLRLTQFLVEPGCTVACCVDDEPIFHPVGTVPGCGRGDCHLASGAGNHDGRDAAGRRLCHGDLRQMASWGQPYSQPQNKGFDEFYGIPPADTWDAFGIIRQGRQTKSLDLPLDKGCHVVAAKRNEPLTAIKPYTEEVRRDIDWELVDHGVDFMKRQKAATKPFFLYLPISRTHFPNLSSKRFDGAAHWAIRRSLLMEGDAIVGKMLDLLKTSAWRKTPLWSLPPTMVLTALEHAHSAATCRIWDRLDLIVARSAT